MYFSPRYLNKKKYKKFENYYFKRINIINKNNKKILKSFFGNTAVAAGMMVAASYSLFAEGCTYNDPQDSSEIAAITRTAIGAILGLGFILGTKSFLDQYEDIKIGGIGGADARKALLIFFVMTLHSFSEGVGVGVSFGGVHGSKLGIFISASSAVPNVPEGLAIAVALISRGLSITTAAVWAVATSLPQPLMAIPAYLFVNTFIPLLPVGLGFAGGAMAWVAFFELLVEAAEDTNIITTVLVSVPSCALMILTQQLLKH
jgi:zinc transporter, ZIP family